MYKFQVKREIIINGFEITLPVNKTKQKLQTHRIVARNHIHLRTKNQ